MLNVACECNYTKHDCTRLAAPRRRPRFYQLLHTPVTSSTAGRAFKRNPKPDHRQHQMTLDSHKLAVIIIDRLLLLPLFRPQHNLQSVQHSCGDGGDHLP